MSAFFVVSIIQGSAIILDEFIFHHKRGLPKWERIGHPMDTMTVIVCLMFLALMPRTPATETAYYVMAITSCIFVTKDEWVHRKFCTAEEMWLHAILFMMHPLLLFTAMNEWENIRGMLMAVSGGIFCFFLYQVLYWNYFEQRLRKNRQERQYRRVNHDDAYDYFGE